MSGSLNQAPPPHSRAYVAGDVEIRPHTNTIVVNGEERYLRQQAMQVLSCLLQRPGELVSKEALNTAIWNDTAVTDDALVQCVVEIRKALGDDPRRPRFVRTVPKGGYSFIGPIRPADVTHVAEALEAPRVPWLPRWTLGVAAVTVVVLIAAAANWRRAETIEWPAAPGKSRVIVLAFDNASKNGELDWMRRGIAEMIVTDLARSPGLSLLAPSQLALFSDGDETDVAAAVDLAKRVNADAFITGTISAVGDTLRVDARVHQADGTLLGSQSLTATHREHVLAEVDRLAEGLSNTLGRPLAPIEAASHLSDVMTHDLAAYREYSLGVEKANALQWKAALEHFENAVRADANFAMAHARIGYTYTVTMGWPGRGEAYLAKAFQLRDRLREQDRLTILAWYALSKLDYPGAINALRTLVARNPDDIEHYWLLSRTLRGEERHDEALAVVTAGLRVNPGAKDLYNELRGIHGTARRMDLAEAAARKYVELSPTEPNAHDSLGLVYQETGRYAEAMASYERALALDPNFDIAVIHIGNTYVAQGRYTDALRAYTRHADMMKLPEMKIRGQSSSAFVYYLRGERQRALQQALAAQSDPASPRYDIAVLALALGDRARFDAELAKPLNTSNRGARFPQLIVDYMRGAKAQADNKADEAIAAFRDAVRRAPISWTIPTWEDCLAEAYFGYGRWAEASVEYRRLLKINPHAALYVYRLAQIADRTGRRDEAAKEYRRFLEIWSTADVDVPEVVAARAWLRNYQRLPTAIAVR